MEYCGVTLDVRMPFERRRDLLSSLALAARSRRVSAFRKPMRYPASAAVRAFGSMPKSSLISLPYLKFTDNAFLG